jgi:hypothetical protein
MTRLKRYDAPAHLTDFSAIPGQLEAWHQFVLETFNSSIAGEAEKLRRISPGVNPRPQFYSEVLDDYGPSIDQAVLWNAFPKELLRRYGRDRALVEADNLWPMSAYVYDWRYDSQVPARTGARFPGNEFSDRVFYRPTVEYCEWHVERDPLTGRIRRVTFTSEPPEYWFAMFGGTIDGSAVSFPGDKHLVLDLYRKLVSPLVEMDDLIVHDPFMSTLGPLRPGDYNPHNKWNTTHGIMHLGAPPNALSAEIGLGADATISYHDGNGDRVVDPDAFIAGTGMGGANRNSDPTIAATVNVLARSGAMVTLANPVGLYMDHIDLAGWEVPGGVSPASCATIVRGTADMIERLVIEFPTQEYSVSDFRIGGEPVRFGGQIAECITVKLVGSAAALSSVKNPSLPLATIGYVDPNNSREIFTAGRRGRPQGTVPAFTYEAAELAARKQSATETRLALLKIGGR